jgi:phosphoglycolate phosphatase
VRYREATTDSKPSMVRELLQRFAGRPALVVGDRGDDVEAAHRNGIEAVAASYGYGSPAELTQADASANSAWAIPEAVDSLLNRV